MKKLVLSIVLGIGCISILPLPSSAASSSIKQTNSTQNGWVQSNSNWYYYQNGTIKTGWVLDNNNWYYLNPDNNGAMTKGWVFKKDNKNWYYLDPVTGVMKTGWQKINEKWYYLTLEEGDMKKGWQQINGLWYYLDPESGDMKKGWQQVYGFWYYLAPTGEMKTGWQQINGRWYNLDSNTGSLIQLEGWKTVDGKWVYYIPSNYGLATNEARTINVNGYPVICHFDSSGYWTAFDANVSAYSADEGTGNAKDGTVITGDPNQKMVAVDPALIPLGTKLYIPGYGEAVAHDTGSAIKGNHIDILFATTKQANYWGRQNLLVEIRY
ncbi:3D domain-containing protein [Microbacteriaceae bacterium 4G12]